MKHIVNNENSKLLDLIQDEEEDDEEDEESE